MCSKRISPCGPLTTPAYGVVQLRHGGRELGEQLALARSQHVQVRVGRSIKRDTAHTCRRAGGGHLESPRDSEVQWRHHGRDRGTDGSRDRPAQERLSLWINRMIDGQLDKY